jgi:hypothetical protein
LKTSPPVATNQQQGPGKGHVTFRDNLYQHFQPNNQDPPFLKVPEEQPPSSVSKKERLLDYLHKKFPSRVVRRVLKCALAYFLTTLFSLIHPLTVAIGSAAFLTSAGSVFNHPGRR